MRHPHRLAALLPLAAISACTTLPPHAADHATRLAEHHHRTHAATLASFDALEHTLLRSLAETRRTLDEDHAEAAAHARDTATTLVRITERLRNAHPMEADRREPIIADLDALRSEHDGRARAIDAARRADWRSLAQLEDDLRERARGLRALAAEHGVAIQRALDRQAALLESVTASDRARGHAILDLPLDTASTTPLPGDSR